MVRASQLYLEFQKIEKTEKKYSKDPKVEILIMEDKALPPHMHYKDITRNGRML